MSLQLAIAILVVLFVVGWFALGTHYNVRKGEQTLVWLQQGLPLIGEKTTLRWLGSSVVELKIPSAKPPFRDAEVLAVLEPRDVAPLWWIARLRGRRDLLVVRGTLLRLPRTEIEAADPKAWTLGSFPNPSSNLPATGGPGPVRFSVRRERPQFEIQWRLDEVRRLSSRDVLEAARRLAESA